MNKKDYLIGWIRLQSVYCALKSGLDYLKTICSSVQFRVCKAFGLAVCILRTLYKMSDNISGNNYNTRTSQISSFCDADKNSELWKFSLSRLDVRLKTSTTRPQIPRNIILTHLQLSTVLSSLTRPVRMIPRSTTPQITPSSLPYTGGKITANNRRDPEY